MKYFLYISVVNCALGYVFYMLATVYGSLVFFFKPMLAPLMRWAGGHHPKHCSGHCDVSHREAFWGSSRWRFG